MKLHAASLFAAIVLAGCMTTPLATAPKGVSVADDRSAVAAGTATETSPSADTQPGRYSSASVTTPAEAELQCKMTVSETVGCTPADVEAMIAPARQRIEECAGSKSGKILIHLRSADGKLAFDLEPHESLDPTERRCILDALALLPVESYPVQTTPGQPRSTGFTSLVTFEW